MMSWLRTAACAAMVCALGFDGFRSRAGEFQASSKDESKARGRGAALGRQAHGPARRRGPAGDPREGRTRWRDDSRARQPRRGARGPQARPVRARQGAPVVRPEAHRGAVRGQAQRRRDRGNRDVEAAWGLAATDLPAHGEADSRAEDRRARADLGGEARRRPRAELADRLPRRQDGRRQAHGHGWTAPTRGRKG